jgi:hypothetical protein
VRVCECLLLSMGAGRHQRHTPPIAGLIWENCIAMDITSRIGVHPWTLLSRRGGKRSAVTSKK